jgi:hypothetical protein
MGDAVFVEEGPGAEASAEPGVGVFFFAPAAELAARLARVAALRAAAAPGEEDVVSAALRRDFGVRVEIAAGWNAAAEARPAAPPCA